MTGARSCCLTPHVERAQVGGICKRLQRLGITECLNGAGGYLLILTVDGPQAPWLARARPDGATV